MLHRMFSCPTLGQWYLTSPKRFLKLTTDWNESKPHWWNLSKANCTWPQTWNGPLSSDFPNQRLEGSQQGNHFTSIMHVAWTLHIRVLLVPPSTSRMLPAIETKFCTSYLLEVMIVVSVASSFSPARLIHERMYTMPCLGTERVCVCLWRSTCVLLYHGALRQASTGRWFILRSRRRCRRKCMLRVRILGCNPAEARRGYETSQ